MEINKDLIPWSNMDNYDDGKVKVSKMSIEYYQDGDSCEDSDVSQCIKLETEDAGGGPFIRISMPEGGHWSIDAEGDSFDKLIKDFWARINYDEGEWERNNRKQHEQD